jgi:hypothetical protein
MGLSVAGKITGCHTELTGTKGLRLKIKKGGLKNLFLSPPFLPVECII